MILNDDGQRLDVGYDDDKNNESVVQLTVNKL